MRQDVNEKRPGSGAMASQAEAEIVSVTLSPLAKVALAAPAQQSSNINVSDGDLSRSVCMADHCKVGESGLRVAHQVLCLESSILAWPP